MKEKVQKIEKLQITGNQKRNERWTHRLAGHLRNISTEGGSIVFQLFSCGFNMKLVKSDRLKLKESFWSWGGWSRRKECDCNKFLFNGKWSQPLFGQYTVILWQWTEFSTAPSSFVASSVSFFSWFRICASVSCECPILLRAHSYFQLNVGKGIWRQLCFPALMLENKDKMSWQSPSESPPIVRSVRSTIHTWHAASGLRGFSGSSTDAEMVSTSPKQRG